MITAMHPHDGADQATACVLCSHNCGLRVDVENGRIAAVRPDESNPITRGYSCNKGYSIAQYVEHEQRVTHPLRRRPDGTFERISWEVAIAEIAARLDAIRKAHSPRSVALVGVGGQANHMDGAWALGFLWQLGSRRWFNAFAQEKTQHPLTDGWISGTQPGVYLEPDVERTRYLLVLGANPKISNQIPRATDLLKELGANDRCITVVVDPRRTETARTADLHLPIAPGRDAELLIALAAVIVQEGLENRAFAARYVADGEPLRAVLRAVDVEEMARRAELPAHQIREVARGFARAEAACIKMDLGIEQGPHNTLTAYLVRVLSVLTGNLGRAGGNVFVECPLPPPPRGARREPAERAVVSGIAGIAAFSDFGMFSPNLFPEEVTTDHPERIRAVIVEGANPMLSFADTGAWRDAFARLELVVVIDPAMTETARLAHYVLPARTGYEKWEFCNFPKGYPAIGFQLRPPVVPAPGEALAEAEIYVRLAEAMKLVDSAPAPLAALGRRATTPTKRALFSATVAAWTTLRERGSANGRDSRTLHWAYRTLGATLPDPSLVVVWFVLLQNALVRRKAVVRELGANWARRSPFAIAEELFRRALANPQGTFLARLDAERNLESHVGHADGGVHLHHPPMLREIERVLAGDRPATDPRYPLILSAGLRSAWTANTIHRDPTWRKGRGPHCALSIHPDDARALGLADGALARLATKVGALELPARLDANLRRGFVAVPNGFGALGPDGRPVGVNLNELTAAQDRDPFTGCPYHKSLPCRVEPVPAAS